MSTGYSVVVAGAGLPGQDDKQALIVKSVEAAGMWLSSLIPGRGTIDIELRFDASVSTMNASALAGQDLGAVTAANGRSYTLWQEGVAAEILTGIDPNGAAPDAVIRVGTTNLDRYYWFDDTLRTSNDIPVDKTDGFRVMLHEILHCLGFNGFLSTIGDSYTGTGISPFDQYFVQSAGRSWFHGPHAMKAFGGPVPVSGPHLGDQASIAAGILTGPQSLMSIDYAPLGNRISLDPVVTGVLRDLGFAARDQQALASAAPGQPATAVIPTKAAGMEVLRTLDLTWVTFSDSDQPAFLANAPQRLQFLDMNIALDTGAGMTGGQAYRIYEAAFNRAPDRVGLGFWLNSMDGGLTLGEVANGFVGSPEFRSLYGSAPSHASIVAQFYLNVLDRPGDAAGLAFWTGLLDKQALTVPQVLAEFSESAENVGALAAVIGEGFPYIAYG